MMSGSSQICHMAEPQSRITSSKPLRPDECRQEVAEQEQHNQRGEDDHDHTLSQPTRKMNSAAIVARPSTKRTGSQVHRSISHPPTTVRWAKAKPAPRHAGVSKTRAGKTLKNCGAIGSH